VFCDSDKEQRVQRLMMRMLVKTGELQRQSADYQSQVSSLTARLDDVNAQLNDCQRKMRDSGTRVHLLCV